MICSSVVFNSCSVNNDTFLQVACGNPVVIDNAAFASTVVANYTIKGVSISENCLTITITSSGCSGNTWEASLVDSGEQTNGLPPQRFLKLVLTNNESCLSVFERSFTFDISSIRSQQSEVILLNIRGWDSQIVLN